MTDTTYPRERTALLLAAASAPESIRPFRHFAAWEQPKLFTEELRAGFRSLRK